MRSEEKGHLSRDIYCSYASRRARDDNSSTSEMSSQLWTSFRNQRFYAGSRLRDPTSCAFPPQHWTVRSHSLKRVFKTPACLQGYQRFSVSSQRCLSEPMPQQPWAHAAADTTAGVLANENNKLPVLYSVGKSFHHCPVTEADILETQS